MTVAGADADADDLCPRSYGVGVVGVWEDWSVEWMCVSMLMSGLRNQSINQSIIES